MTILTQGRLQRQIQSKRDEIATIDISIRDALGLRSLPSYRAINRIARTTGPAALTRLTRSLESDRWQDRWLTLHLLKDLRLRAANSRVQDALLDENPHVRHAAAAAWRVLDDSRDAHATSHRK